VRKKGAVKPSKAETEEGKRVRYTSAQPNRAPGRRIGGRKGEINGPKIKNRGNWEVGKGKERDASNRLGTGEPGRV